jgi:hypothetical protein
MDNIGDPNRVIGALAVAGLAMVALWRLLVWVRNAPLTPDPWDAETERQVHEPDAVEVCHHCFSPQPRDAWFCQKCGTIVGPCSNFLPFVYIFSVGEVFRNGVNNRLRASPLIIAGYVLAILFFPIIGFFCLLIAPFYLHRFFGNLLHARPEGPEEPAELPEEGK